MITCPKCSKENQDHYKFCLGCGAELPRDAAPKPFTRQTPPHAMKPVVAAPAPVAYEAPAPAAVQPLQIPRPAAPAAAPAPTYQAPAAPPAAAPAAPPPAAAPATCPVCGHANQPGHKFCAACGTNLTVAPTPPVAPAPVAAPAPAPVAAAPQPAALALNVVLTALRADGTDIGTYALPSASTTVGRDSGGIFAGDSYLSPRHATFHIRAGRLFVKDEASLNGVYVKLAREAPAELRDGDVFRIGQEIIRFERLKPQPATADGVERLGSPSKGYVGRISLVTGRDTTGNSFPVPEAGIHIGRERGDVLFPEDGYVSGLHCRVGVEGDRVALTDLGSSNGTFLRLLEERELRSGDVLLMGQQVFRVSF